MSNKNLNRQRVRYFDEKPTPEELQNGESGVNNQILNDLLSQKPFSRKKWAYIVKLLIDNHYEDGSINDAHDIAIWADVHSTTFWRIKNELIERELVILTNRNGRIAFNPDFVMVKNYQGEIVIPTSPRGV